MSLSELSRLPVSNLRLSAHISAQWIRKKKPTKTLQKEPRERTDRGIVLTLRLSTVSHCACVEAARGCVCLFAGGADLCAASLSLVKTASCLCSRRLQLLGSLQNQLDYTFTSAFEPFVSDMMSLCTTSCQACSWRFHHRSLVFLILQFLGFFI